ncbi:MAG: CGNR zinc finger domain-containing protein [Candidatus Dormibacteraceae bacterium]
MPITKELCRLQHGGFPMGGEPDISIDLVDTLMQAVEPPIDLLQTNPDGWWSLEAHRLPEGPAPDLVATQRLRAALRELFEARIDHRRAAPGALEDLNAFAGSVPTTPRLVVTDSGAHVATRWHSEYGGNPRLAGIARNAIALLGDPHRRDQLRRCANPGCSMLFVAENRRRVWCTPNICGNRARVARHHRRHRNDSTEHQEDEP